MVVSLGCFIIFEFNISKYCFLLVSKSPTGLPMLFFSDASPFSLNHFFSLVFSSMVLNNCKINLRLLLYLFTVHFLYQLINFISII